MRHRLSQIQLYAVDPTLQSAVACVCQNPTCWGIRKNNLVVSPPLTPPPPPLHPSPPLSPSLFLSLCECCGFHIAVLSPFKPVYVL